MSSVSRRTTSQDPIIRKTHEHVNLEALFANRSPRAQSWGTKRAVEGSVVTRDIIVVGASAGGVEAISTVVAHLPRDLRAVLLVVLHVSRGRSVLPEILTRAGRLPAIHPNDGRSTRIRSHLCRPPDHHLTVESGRARVVHGPTENGCRPAIDPLFRSAAACMDRG